jgi:uncharacterized glyoxalase superfamily protein PhnB
MAQDFQDRDELRQLQREAEELHGHPFEYAIRRHFFGVVPVFLVDDIPAACEYYERVLGFEVGFSYGEPAKFASVYRNQAVIHLIASDTPGARNSALAAGMASAGDAYVVVNDIEGLFEEMKRHGAAITSELTTQEYGMREFQVEDLNGYRLTLAQGIFQPEEGQT